MRFIFSTAIIVSCSLATVRSEAQASWPTPEIEQTYHTAQNYLKHGDFTHAIPVYQQIIQLAPEVMEPYRDLGQAYYLTGNYPDADKILASIIDTRSADPYCYQLAAASFSAEGENKKAKNILKKGIELFPKSGLLYHELGKTFDDKNETQEALKMWLDGIEADPGYHVNYYEAAKTYASTRNVIWTIIYGEIFVNIEHHTPRADETRKMLMDAYRSFYTTSKKNAPSFGTVNEKKQAANFEDAVRQTLQKLAPVVADGVTTENLIMLRTRFISEWEQHYAKRFPFSLFSYQRKMLGDGYFDTYNQWLFGKAEDTNQYESWNKFHKDVMPSFEQWLDQYAYRPTGSDFYNNKNLDKLFEKKKT